MKNLFLSIREALKGAEILHIETSLNTTFRASTSKVELLNLSDPCIVVMSSEEISTNTPIKNGIGLSDEIVFERRRTNKKVASSFARRQTMTVTKDGKTTVFVKE